MAAYVRTTRTGGSNPILLRHRVWLLRQSPGNSAKWPLLWPVLSTQPNQRGTNIGVIRRCASVSLRAGAGWFGFAIASANAAGTLVADVADIEMSRRPYGCYAGEGTTQNCSAFCPSRIDSVPLGNYRGRRPASRSSKLNRTASPNSGAIIAQDDGLAVSEALRVSQITEETLPAYTGDSERSARSFSPAVAGAIASATQIAV